MKTFGESGNRKMFLENLKNKIGVVFPINEEILKKSVAKLMSAPDEDRRIYMEHVSILVSDALFFTCIAAKVKEFRDMFVRAVDKDKVICELPPEKQKAELKKMQFESKFLKNKANIIAGKEMFDDVFYAGLNDVLNQEFATHIEILNDALEQAGKTDAKEMKRFCDALSDVYHVIRVFRYNDRYYFANADMIRESLLRFRYKQTEKNKAAAVQNN